MRLLLIRHGQTTANVLGSLDTAEPGPSLTALGVRQAAEVPGALDGVDIDAIFVSTLLRTHETAVPLARSRGHEVIALAGIHEIEAGEHEGRTDHHSTRRYLETVFAWGLGERDRPMPGAGNGHDFFARFDASISDAAATVKATTGDSGRAGAGGTRGTVGTAVVFSHGAAIRVWVAGRAANVPPSFAGSHELDNTGIVELDGSPEAGWSLTRWQGTPIGGEELADAAAEDPTGETLAEARAEDRAEDGADADADGGAEDDAEDDRVGRP